MVLTITCHVSLLSQHVYLRMRSPGASLSLGALSPETLARRRRRRFEQGDSGCSDSSKARAAARIEQGHHDGGLRRAAATVTCAGRRRRRRPRMASSSRSSVSPGSFSPSLHAGGPSPLPYREMPLDYVPAVFCDCQKKAARWISWTDRNPGRRFVKCAQYRSPNGCLFWSWYDAPTPEHLKPLIVDLRDAVLSLRDEKIKLNEAMIDLRSVRNDWNENAAELVAMRDSVLKKNGEIMKQNKKLEKERLILIAAIVGCVATLFFVVFQPGM